MDKEVYSIYQTVKQRDINDEIHREPITKEYFNEVLKSTKDPVKLIEKIKRSFFGQGKYYNESKGRTPIKTDFSVFKYSYSVIKGK